ncbi:RDD family protein [Methylomonas sp. SURF-2]|uniref:RDD family protein n=1 Tax=Methylomonas subterranea TaxID=2952225 RepID=A0ABT1TJG6_9GAMM|nr:RDD family protein [Methylomonas sp. SURF-2]MCQ8105614.1 RDD family protein [Methylomonas sp. SURF-2]
MGAVIYDALLLLAVWFFATALILPFNSGQAFSSEQYFFPIYLVAVSYAFYGWFWTHGGQTLGLRAWKIKLVALDGGAVGWKEVSLRFAAAILSWGCVGLGFFWCVFDKSRCCWHDRLSNTRLVLVQTEKSGRQN